MHTFTTQHDKEAMQTINLYKSRVNQKKETRFEVVETKKGFLGNKKTT